MMVCYWWNKQRRAKGQRVRNSPYMYIIQTTPARFVAPNIEFLPSFCSIKTKKTLWIIPFDHRCHLWVVETFLFFFYPGNFIELSLEVWTQAISLRWTIFPQICFWIQISKDTVILQSLHFTTMIDNLSSELCDKGCEIDHQMSIMNRGCLYLNSTHIVSSTWLSDYAWNGRVICSKWGWTED